MSVTKWGPFVTSTTAAWSKTQTRCEYILVRSGAASLPHTVCLFALPYCTGKQEYSFNL